MLVGRGAHHGANDMLTPTLKLKRRNVMTKYEADLDALYS